ncbi:MAG TPA: response regulator [Desulfomonilia bacterium]|nr:response regulator [Desulfomonilia bacterium]
MRQDKNLSILLVEDNEGDARLIREMFRSIPDVELTRADSLSTALEYLRHHSAEIVLLDLGLPDSHGLATVTSFAARMQALPIVVLTGLGDDMLALDALKAGAQDYLVKGLVEPEMLMRSIRYAKERKLVEVALRESEERYRITLEGMLDAVSIQIIKDARYLYVNKAFCDITGYNPEEVIDRTPFDLNLPLTPEDQDNYLECILERPGRGRKEIQYRMKDGTILYALLSCTPVLYRNEDCAVVVMTDITALKKAEESRKRLEIQLAQAKKMEALGTLAGGIAHDFNNILTAITGFTEIALHNVSIPEKVEKHLTDALRSGRRARDLLRQVLAFSRHAAGEYAPVTLAYPIKESLGRLRTMIPGNIEISQNLVASAKVMADPAQISQMIINLCMNAAQVMETSGGRLSVSLDEVQLDDEALSLNLAKGPYLKLVVGDTGPGMPPEIMEHIFEPYFTTKKLGDGSGMGLAVVHGIVKRHGGAISCRSTPGQGTIFEIYLPKTMQKEEWEEPRVPMEMPTGTERILFVDDEPALVDLAQSLFESLGYQVTATSSSTQALELFRKDPGRYDVVVTDMTMPEMTGDRLSQEMMEIRPDLPVILYTGYSEYMSEEQAKAMGIREFILKPFGMRDMAHAIRKVLDENREVPKPTNKKLSPGRKK